jgi:hypothetical protein
MFYHRCWGVIRDRLTRTARRPVTIYAARAALPHISHGFIIRCKLAAAWQPVPSSNLATQLLIFGLS